MSTTKTLLPLDRARQLADKLITRLAPSCARIEVAGSIRRGKPQVGDIELVAIPRMLDQLDLFGAVVSQDSMLDRQLDGLLSAGHITRTVPPGWATTPAWGARYKKFWLRLTDAGELAQVDLFITFPEAWGAIFTIRTGPSSFSEALVTHIKNRTPYRQQGGVLIIQDTGEVVPVPEERDYFALAGVPWIAPEERTAARLWQVVHPKPNRGQPQAKDGDEPEGGENKIGNILHPKIDSARCTVKALTLWQPWATLIVAGRKTIETRAWSTDYRGLLAIHAAKREPDVDYWDLDVENPDALPWPPPLGAVVCLTRLVDVVPSEQLRVQDGFLFSMESYLGDYSPGRYGWKLQLVEVYDPPIPAQGDRGLWDWAPPEHLIAPTQRTKLDCARAVNIHTERCDVLVDRHTSWGNPFSDVWCDDDRATVIRRYHDWLFAPEQVRLLAQVPTLAGKRLGCHCKPQACHADVLAVLANAAQAGTWRPGEPSPLIWWDSDSQVRAQIRARLENGASHVYR